jgi:hypothetical protein
MKNIDLGLNRYICCQYGVTKEFDLDTFDILKETYFDGIYNDIIVIYDYKTKLVRRYSIDGELLESYENIYRGKLTEGILGDEG